MTMADIAPTEENATVVTVMGTGRGIEGAMTDEEETATVATSTTVTPLDMRTTSAMIGAEETTTTAVVEGMMMAGMEAADANEAVAMARLTDVPQPRKVASPCHSESERRLDGTSMLQGMSNTPPSRQSKQVRETHLSLGASL